MPKTVTYLPRQTSHGVHLFLTIITCGVWAFTGWPFFIVLNAIAKRRVVTKTID